MAFSEHAISILKKNYYARDGEGRLKEKQPSDLMHRLANSIFPNEAELAYNLYDALMEQKVIFNSPVMFNLGLPTKQILAACWVGDLTDDMDSILESVQVTGQVFKYGSGMGLPLTNLRPKKDVVSNSGYASGPLSFMELFDKAGEVIKSGGKRRAAFMSMNRVDHPDIKMIIEAKYDAVGGLGGQYLENMNISIAATDEFMLAVKNDAKFELRFDGKVYEVVEAAQLFDLIARCAHRSGDPGLFFIDQANRFNTLPKFADIQSTNPCGEQALHPYTCCNLGHINLTALTYKKNGAWEFDYEEFHELTRLMTVALDRIVDIMDYPSRNFEFNTLEVRPIGLGFTGFAETMYRLRVPYSNSQKFVRNLSHLMLSTSIETSIELAELYGTTKTIKDNLATLAVAILSYTGDYDLYERCLESGIRNSSWTTLAPTGTTSLAVDAKSYGIEPHFGLAYRKNFVSQDSDTVEHQEMYFNETFAEAIKDLNIDPKKLAKDIMDNHGSCQSLEYIPESIRRVFEVAHDLAPKQHLQIMAAAQPYISSAISKTINLPNTATVDDVKEVYMTAWELGLKGATVYRDGCKEFQPIDFSDGMDKGIAQFAKLPRGASIVRGDEADGGGIDAWRTACTKMYVATGYSQSYKDVLIETFLAKRAGGGCDSNLKAIALLVSLALRKGVQVKDIEDELFSITCTHCISAKANGKDINALSCPQAIARTLRKQVSRASNYEYYNRELDANLSDIRRIEAPTKAKTPVVGRDLCIKCGEPTILASGCLTCPSCGHGGCDHGRE